MSRRPDGGGSLAKRRAAAAEEEEEYTLSPVGRNSNPDPRVGPAFRTRGAKGILPPVTFPSLGPGARPNAEALILMRANKRRLLAAISVEFNEYIVSPFLLETVFDMVEPPAAGGFRRSRQRGGMFASGLLTGPRMRRSARAGIPPAAASAAPPAALSPATDPIREIRAISSSIINSGTSALGSAWTYLARAIRIVGSVITYPLSSVERFGKTVGILFSTSSVLFGSQLYNFVLPAFTQIYTTPVLLNALITMFYNTGGAVAASLMAGGVAAPALGLAGAVLLLAWVVRKVTSTTVNTAVVLPVSGLFNILQSTDGEIDEELLRQQAAVLGAISREIESADAAAAIAAAEARVRADQAAAAELLRQSNEDDALEINIQFDSIASAVGPNAPPLNMFDTLGNIKLVLFGDGTPGAPPSAFYTHNKAAIDGLLIAAVAEAKRRRAAAVAEVASAQAADAVGAGGGNLSVALAAAQGGAGGGGAASAAPSSSSSAVAAAASPLFAGAAASPFGGGGASSASASAAPGGSTGGSGFGGGYRRLRLRNKQNKKSKKRQNRKQNSKKSRRLRFRF